MDNIIIGLIFITHVLLAYRTQLLINDSDYLTASRKRINTILNWTIPFVWSFVARNYLKAEKLTAMTKSKRDRKSGGNNSDNWIGLTGGG